MMNRFLQADAALSQRLTFPTRSRWWKTARILAHLGDGQYIFAALGLLILAGWAAELPSLYRAGLSILLVVLLTMAAVTLVKFIVRRRRPRPPGEFVAFGYDKYSFPSGHAARLTALTAAVAFFCPAFGWPTAIITLLTATARVLVGVHYVSDVLAGIGIGLLSGWLGVWLVSAWL